MYNFVTLKTTIGTLDLHIYLLTHAPLQKVHRGRELMGLCAVSCVMFKNKHFIGYTVEEVL